MPGSVGKFSRRHKNKTSIWEMESMSEWDQRHLEKKWQVKGNQETRHPEVSVPAWGPSTEQATVTGNETWNETWKCLQTVVHVIDM